MHHAIRDNQREEKESSNQSLVVKQMAEKEMRDKKIIEFVTDVVQT
jgi:hypothetical protein